MKKFQLTQSRKKNITTQTQVLFRLAKEHHWKFKTLGNAPVPQEALRVENWLIIPAIEDKSFIPPHAFEKIEAVYKAGIQPQAWVVVHEAPMVLPETTATKKNQKRPFVLPYLIALGGLGIWLASTVITTVAIVDPILIAITPDNDWIEIDRWI